MKTSNVCLIAATAAVILTTATGCLARRRTIVIHETCPQPAVAVPVTVQEAPPPPCVEMPPTSPSPAHVWVEGVWVWDRRWVWRPGVWVVRPQPHAVWVSGHWTRRGNVWVMSPGHWR